MSMLYNLRRINEICREHVGNNFLPLPKEYIEEFCMMQTSVEILFNDVTAMMEIESTDTVATLRRRCDSMKDEISESYHRLHKPLREGDTRSMTVIYVYLNLLQETREMVSSLRKFIRAYAKLHGETRVSLPALTSYSPALQPSGL